MEVEVYDHSSDKTMEETAKNMVALANKTGKEVVTHWSDDEISVYPGDCPDDIITIIEWSTASQRTAEKKK